jgi:hypothetical protein
MKKRTFWLTVLAVVLLLSTPALAADSQGENGAKSTGKHNFDQWQTIKRLQIIR